MGSALPGTDRTGLKAVLPLAVHNKWVVLHDPGGPPNAAEVLLLVAGEPTPPCVSDSTTMSADAYPSC
ncbi:hypothetical protein BZL30_9389 [Mycobacterium kansasii]|uniref:Uncharacterized protein n=1 Tax=Mycobacterium kansasii TaxID=1768 RepID=A0A1V3W9T9_MYCKA|nr:hypothetical protein BZL30_9389 [Mycobacterium kansasii]